MHRRLFTAVFAFLCILAGGTIVAQVPGNPVADPPASPEKVLARFLELSEAQIQDIRNLAEKRHDTVQPLRDQLAARQKSWRDLMEGPNPDPAAVGALALEMHGLRRQIGDIHKQFADSLSSVLNEEQTKKLQLLRRASRLQPVIRAGRALGIL